MSPHRRRLGVEERRAEILEAARRVFSTTPYTEASTQTIAEMCGASQGLIFHYFGSKAGLYTQFLAATSRSLDRALQGAADAHANAPFVESLTHGLNVYLDYVAAHPFLWAAGRRNGEEPTEAVNFRIERRDATVDYLCNALGANDQATAVAASGFVGFLDAVCLDWVDQGCQASQRPLIIAAARGALEGALAEKLA